LAEEFELKTYLSLSSEGCSSAWGDLYEFEFLFSE